MTLARKSQPGRAFLCRFCPRSSTGLCSFWRKTSSPRRCRRRRFKIVQKRLAAAVAGQLQSPEFLTHQALTSALFPKDDPSLRHATPVTVQSLTLQDVKDYYRHVFRPDLATIVVIGNVTPEEAKAVISQVL